MRAHSPDPSTPPSHIQSIRCPASAPSARVLVSLGIYPASTARSCRSQLLSACQRRASLTSPLPRWLLHCGVVCLSHAPCSAQQNATSPRTLTGNHSHLLPPPSPVAIAVAMRSRPLRLCTPPPVSQNTHLRSSAGDTERSKGRTTSSAPRVHLRGWQASSAVCRRPVQRGCP